jgi:hypothetical protein
MLPAHIKVQDRSLDCVGHRPFVTMESALNYAFHGASAVWGVWNEAFLVEKAVQLFASHHLGRKFAQYLHTYMLCCVKNGPDCLMTWHGTSDSLPF